MAQFMNRSLLAVLGGALSVGLLYVSCGNNGSERSASAGAGNDAAAAGLGGTAGSGAGGAPASGASGNGAAGTGGYSGDAAGDAWVPPGDPGWQPVPWACGGISVASIPTNAAPPLEWESCGPVFPGCQRLLVTWESLTTSKAIQTAHVLRTATSLNVMLGFSYGKEEDGFVAAYVGGAPIVVWRYAPGLAPAGCSMLTPIWTPSHVCFVTQQVFEGGASMATHILLSPTTLSGPPLASWSSNATYLSGCSTELLGSMDSAGTGFIRDLDSGQEHQLTVPSGEAWLPAIYNDVGLFQRWWGDGISIRLDGWIWKRPNVMEPLVEPPAGEMVYNIRTDGTTLVWIQAKSTSVLDRAAGDLWTSPFATTMAALQPSKRRAVPMTSVAPLKLAGGGYYAIIEQPVGSEDWKLHAYRLSDARHWQVALPDGMRPIEVLYVDAEEVWVRAEKFKTIDITIVRQRFDQLGPGD